MLHPHVLDVYQTSLAIKFRDDVNLRDEVFVQVPIAGGHLEPMPVGFVIFAGPVSLGPPSLVVLAAMPCAMPAGPLVGLSGSFAASLRLWANVTCSASVGEPVASMGPVAGLSRKSKT